VAAAVNALPGAVRPWQSRLAAPARRRPVEIALGLVLVAGLTLWVYAGVHRALVHLAAQNLHTLVTSEQVALDAWVGEKRLNVQRWASDSRVVEAAERLLLAAGRGAAELQAACAGATGALLVGAIDRLRQADAAASVHLIDRDGRIVAARSGAKCGHLLSPDQRAVFAPVLGGAVRFTASLGSVERVGLPDVDGMPKVWIAAPVINAAGEVIAVLDIGKPAAERFSRLFEAVRSGSTGEAYAFDARGRLLTESRFRTELEEDGRLRPGQSTILALRLTDAEDESAEPRLSRLIGTALAERTARGERQGEQLDPYVNYVGERVIGAWRWFDDYDFGVAVEVAESEAFAPLARLNTVFAVLGMMVGVAVFGLVVTLLRMQRMAREVEAAAQVGNYELFEEIGQGGIARVYRAQHRLLKRPTAVKVIQLHQSTDELLARFDREVRLCSQLMHPNTIEIFDYGRTPDGLPFYAMELLDGATLQQLVERHGPFPAARTVHVLRGIAGSLAEAHERGLVHRDVTPANVMLCRKGGLVDMPKLLDFGLIKDTRGEHTRDLTRALKILGTPSYMAPERIERPDSADFRSDLYAVGAVGYFLLTGNAPAGGGTDLSLAYHVVNTVPPAVETVAPLPVPAALADLVTRCLAKHVEDRPQTAAGIGETLDRIALEHPWSQSAARAWWDAHPLPGTVGDAPPAAA
jgi:eukaryotic-like serine/threonine-protein kinase